MSCNVIKEYVDNTKKNYLEYTKNIMGKYFDKEIFEEYLNTYVDTRYYKENIDVRTTLEGNINYYLNKIYEKNPSKTSKFILELFKMFYYLDGVKEFKEKEEFRTYVKELNQIRIEKLNIKDEKFINVFSNLVHENKRKKINFLNAFDTKDFYLKAIKVPHQNIYNISLKHQISIPKLYSDYAVDKVYNNGLIKEDKLFIEYYLVNKNLLEDVIEGIFDREYLVEFCPSMMEKKEKTKKLLNIMDNDISKECISLKINYEDFIRYKEEIYNYIQVGFKFCVILDNYFKKHIPEPASLDIFNYIIIPDDSYRNMSLSSRRNVIEG